jgi:hypothetical protein
MQKYVLYAAAALALAGALVTIVAALTGPGPAAPAPRASSRPPTASEFPAPPRNAVVFAQEDDANVVALAVRSRNQQLSLQSSVVGPDGRGVDGLALGFAVRTGIGQVVRTAGTACGRGCYAATLATDPPRRVTVTVGEGSDQRSIDFALPRPWPPADANALVLRSGRVWRNLRTLVWRERLASDARHSINTLYGAVAPNGLSYQIKGGAAAVVIGVRRWDRASPTGPWRRSFQRPPLRQPIPFWSGVRNAHVVASPTVRGRRTWLVTFFDPRTPAWFTVVLDQATLRTLDLRMATTAHFMHHVYGPFNHPLELRPPR